MNRSLINVLFGGIAAPAESMKKIEGVVTKVRYCDRARPQGLTFGKTSVEETVESLLDAETVIITPGYGLAVAKAVRFPLIAYMVHFNKGSVSNMPLPKLSSFLQLAGSRSDSPSIQVSLAPSEFGVLLTIEDSCRKNARTSRLLRRSPRRAGLKPSYSLTYCWQRPACPMTVSYYGIYV